MDDDLFPPMFDPKFDPNPLFFSVAAWCCWLNDTDASVVCGTDAIHRTGCIKRVADSIRVVNVNGASFAVECQQRKHLRGLFEICGASSGQTKRQCAMMIAILSNSKKRRESHHKKGDSGTSEQHGSFQQSDLKIFRCGRNKSVVKKTKVNHEPILVVAFEVCFIRTTE